MSTLITQDGTAIVIDPELGAVSARTREEAEAEIRRRKALRQRSDGGLNIIHRHTEIQTGEAA
ncbi:hypothetical protein [Rhizobium sp. LC145]|uniref:hypothetical protein n=1 Tax=Rhizobium sp. LC145 TaxID=1120688 RepID=UPI00062A4891|nr:hypothetical protein [Rhizobium sp. LC145]KKX29213.1 hypothetical protein YH62_15550 [Rhizobium sp. LC145]TKT68814.1 hypothetical protein FDR95_00085 [Rhizobiaceae bacterium LC148]